MIASRFVPLTVPVLLLLAASAPLDAQGRARSSPPLGRVRIVSLGTREPFELAVLPQGEVRIGGYDELRTVGLDDTVTQAPMADLADLGYATQPVAFAITSDGTRVAGHGFSNALYNEAMWWDVDALDVPHGLGGDLSDVYVIENTPSGLVMGGSHDSLPFEVRNGIGRILPGLGGASSDGVVSGISADGLVSCGSLINGFTGTAVRWVDGVAEELAHPPGTSTYGTGISEDGQSFCGAAGTAPAVWLAQDGGAIRALLDHDGQPFSFGQARGVLDDGFTYGDGYRDGVHFGWVWHPSYGGNEVKRFDAWMTRWSSRPLHVESVNHVRAAGGSFHFSLFGGSGSPSWYVRTPRQP